MASTAVTIADAVVDRLNAGPLPLPCTVERWYVPVRDLKDLIDEGLVLSVVPVTIEGTVLDRAGHYMEVYGVAVGIQQVIGQGVMTNDQIKAAVDPLMDFAEQITELFELETIGTNPPVTCTGYTNDPIYSPHHLDEKRVFTSVLIFTFKTGR